MFGGLAYSYGITTAESDFWNGASGGTPAFTFGARFGKLATELQYRSFTLNNLHETSKGRYDIDVKDTQINIGIRYFLNEMFHYNVGLVRHSIEVKYKTDGTAKLGSKAIAGAATNIYVGGGFHGPFFFDGAKWLVDMNYFHHSMDFGVFTFDFGITYEFWSF